MTREEAVKMLQVTRLMLMDGANQPISDLYYALGMAIEALEQTENSSEKPNNCEPKICDTCRYYNSNIPCGSTPSACKEADKFAKEFVDGLKKLKQKDEPQIDNLATAIAHGAYCKTCKHLGDEDCDCDIVFTGYEPKDEPQTEQVGVPFGEMDDATFKSHCLNCQRDTADIKCLDCDGNKYFLSYGSEADCPWK